MNGLYLAICQCVWTVDTLLNEHGGEPCPVSGFFLTCTTDHFLLSLDRGRDSCWHICGIHCFWNANTGCAVNAAVTLANVLFIQRIHRVWAEMLVQVRQRLHHVAAKYVFLCILSRTAADWCQHRCAFMHAHRCRSPSLPRPWIAHIRPCSHSCGPLRSFG